MGKIRDIIISGKSSSSNDDDIDIDDITKEIEKEQLRKVKEAKLRNYLLQTEIENKRLENEIKEYEIASKSRRTSIRDLEKGSWKDYEEEKDRGKDNDDSNKITLADVEVAKELEKYPEDERKKLLATLAFIKSNPNTTDSNALLLPIMVSMMGSAGSDPTKQVAELMTAMATIIQAMNKDNLKIDLVGLLKELRESMKSENSSNQITDKVISMAIQNLFNQPDPKQYIMSLKEDFETFKKIFGGTDNLEYLKLEQAMKESDRKWELALKNLEMQRELAREEMKARIADKQKILDLVDEIQDAAKQALMEETTTPNIETSKGPIPVEQPEIVKTKCPQCGADLYYSPKYTKRVVCPNCGAEFEVTEEKEEKKEEKVETNEQGTGEGKTQ